VGRVLHFESRLAKNEGRDEQTNGICFVSGLALCWSVSAGSSSSSGGGGGGGGGCVVLLLALMPTEGCWIHHQKAKV
jgi:hypothetical protein